MPEIQFPDFTKPRKSFLEAALANFPVPSLGSSPPPDVPTLPSSEVPTIPSEVPNRLDPAAEPQPSAAAVPNPGLTAPTAPSRLDQLQSQYSKVGAPPQGIGGKLAQALATFAPTALGAIFGGTYGASGAAQGTGEALDIKRGQENLQKKSLIEEMENERQRQERMSERELQGQIALGGQAERMAATQAIVAGRQGVADTQVGGKSLAAGLGADAKKAATEAVLRKAGFKTDDDGNIQPLGDDEMSAGQKQDLTDKQGLTDLRKADADLATARAEVERLKNDPTSPAYQLALKRVANTQAIHDTAAQRLGLSQQQFELRSQGTVNGVAPQGSMLTDDNKPVGTAFQQNVRPTGVERNKKDLADSGKAKADELIKLVTNRPDIFGPVAGRKTELTAWLGSQDPDAQRFTALTTFMVDHFAGVFGGRSEATLDALKNAGGRFKDNPAAILAALDEFKKGADIFIKAGTVKTTGSKAAGGGTKKYNPATGRVE